MRRRAGKIANARAPSGDAALAPDVAAQIPRWLEHLAHERRYSAKTLEAYDRDLRQVLDFLNGHLGRVPTLATLAKLEPMDVRAFLASRRAAGISGRSLMRTLAGARYERDRPWAFYRKTIARSTRRFHHGRIGTWSGIDVYVSLAPRC